MVFHPNQEVLMQIRVKDSQAIQELLILSDLQRCFVFVFLTSFGVFVTLYSSSTENNN